MRDCPGRPGRLVWARSGPRRDRERGLGSLLKTAAEKETTTMMSKRLAAILPGLFLAAWAGCASTLPSSTSCLREGNPGRALALAQSRVAANDEDARGWRDLGIARYQLGRHEEALQALDRALDLSPDDRQTLLFRARSLDALQRIPDALAAYGRCAARERGKEEEAVRARIEQLRRQAIRAEMARVVAREESLRAVSVPENAVAVPDFANPAEADTLRPLAKGLAAMVATDLSRLERLRVLERQRLSTLLEELRRSRAGTQAAGLLDEGAVVDPIETVSGQQQRLAMLIDPSSGEPYYAGSPDGAQGPRFLKAVRAFQAAHGLAPDGVAGPRTRAALDRAWAERGGQPLPSASAPVSGFDQTRAPRMGRLLGARRIIQGSLLPMGADGIQLRADLLDILDPAGATSSRPAEGPFAKLLDLQKNLVLGIVDAMGIELTDEERDLLERRETRDLRAFLAYCRGIDFEDRGMQDEALSQYREAFTRDRGFTLARRSAATLSTGASDLEGIEEAAIEDLSAPAEGGASRAAATAVKVGIAPELEDLLGIDTRMPDPLRFPDGGSDGRGRIIVEGDLPGRGGP